MKIKTVPTNMQNDTSEARNKEGTVAGLTDPKRDKRRPEILATEAAAYRMCQGSVDAQEQVEKVTDDRVCSRKL